VKIGNTINIISIIFISQVCLAQNKNMTRPVSPIDFFKESITLSVDESTASVSGIYYFRNNSDNAGRMPILFPFFVDSTSIFPDTMCAYIVNEKDTTYLDCRNTGQHEAVMIAIPLSPNCTTVWHLDYRQKIFGPRATYILTSTGAWGKPLEEATYRFIVPKAFKDVQIWPEADSTLVKGKSQEYLAHRIDFMPGQDMTIHWKSK
jgi:hypothetical protein